MHMHAITNIDKWLQDVLVLCKKYCVTIKWVDPCFNYEEKVIFLEYGGHETRFSIFPGSDSLEEINEKLKECLIKLNNKVEINDVFQNKRIGEISFFIEGKNGQ